MTTTLTPLDLYRERIPVARAAFDDAFGLLPVPQRRRDMARRLWGQVHAQVPEMPVPVVDLFESGPQLTWRSDLPWNQAITIQARVPKVSHGYDLWFCDMAKWTVLYDPIHTYSIEPLLRVCQRFVAATAREVR